jgi:hypothetical protein
MIGDDLLMVLAPWVIFAAAFVIVCFRVRWPRRPRERPRDKDAQPSRRKRRRGGARDGEPPAFARKQAVTSQRRTPS